jgi:hypothetical protein
MARTKQIQQPDSPRMTASTRSGPGLSRTAVIGLVASVLTAFWAAAMLTSLGNVLYVYLFVFTEFYAGVVVLVGLSLTVMLGLVATDRLVLSAKHRLLLQSAHRALGIVAVSALVLHIMTKISTGRAGPLDPIVPFVTGRSAYIGMGTIAGYLLTFVLWTGIVRARFCDKGPRWMWRALHSTAYAAWPVALMHGLNAGRPPAAWVQVSYLVCVIGVVLTLTVRMSVYLVRRGRDTAQTTGSIKPVGKILEDGDKGRLGVSGMIRRKGAEDRTGEGRRGRTGSDIRVSRDESWVSNLRPGPPDPILDSRAPAGGSRGKDRRSADRFTVPEVSRARVTEEPPARDEVRQERRRRAAPEPSESRRRPVEEPAYDEERRRRPAPERSESRRRPVEEPAYDEVRAERRRPSRERAPIDEPSYERELPEEPWDSPRRWASAELTEEAPAPRRERERRPADGYEEKYWETPRRYAVEDDLVAETRPRSGPRHSKDDDYLADDLVESRTSRYAPEEPEVFEDDTPTLVDLASRRARRDAEGGKSRRGRKPSADAVDDAYWTRLRGEAQ